MVSLRDSMSFECKMNPGNSKNEIIIDIEEVQFSNDRKGFDMSIKSNSSTSYRHSFLEFLLENFSVFQHLFPLTKSWILVIFVAWTKGKPQDQFDSLTFSYHTIWHHVLFCYVIWDWKRSVQNRHTIANKVWANHVLEKDIFTKSKSFFLSEFSTRHTPCIVLESLNLNLKV